MRKLSFSRFIFFFGILAFALPGFPQSSLKMTIKCEGKTFKMGQPIPITVTLENVSSRAILLVFNYDDSYLSWPIEAHQFCTGISHKGKGVLQYPAPERFREPLPDRNEWRVLQLITNGQVGVNPIYPPAYGVNTIIDMAPGMYIKQKILLVPDAYKTNQFGVNLQKGGNIIQLEYKLTKKEFKAITQRLKAERILLSCPVATCTNIFSGPVQSNKIAIQVK